MPHRKRRIAVIGDSHVEALGPLLADLAQKRGDDLNYEPHRGSFTRQWAEKDDWGSWLSEYRPQLVLIVLGTNDAMTPHPEALLPHYAELAEKIRKQTRAIVVWIEPPQLERLKRLDAVRANIRSLKNVIIVHGDQLVVEIQPDKIHPTMSGYRTWARDIERHM